VRGCGQIDVHQHLWPAGLVDALRARRAAPYLRDWTLHTAGEAPYEVVAADHDPAARAALDPHLERALVCLSAPLGIEYLPSDEAAPLLASWHDGVRELPDRFRGWAAFGVLDPDVDGLTGLFAAGFVGVQVPAPALGSPPALDAVAAVLRRCEELGRPVLVHPGPVSPLPAGVPSWWAPVVDYSAQLAAAWWVWHGVGRRLFPDLRVCFVAGAGLAPLQHERFATRGGGRFVVDQNAFVDTSSHGRQAVDALTRALGIDVIVLGSDRPYGQSVDPRLGAAAAHAVGVTNPHRLLEGATA
jgi:hypothetical protein